jgi:DNA-binding NarL/FixJ family response regulator
LTPRELTVLTLMAEGLTAAAIARRLGISPRTITKHQENLYRKLGTSDRLGAVLRGLDLGVISREADQRART